MPCRWDSCSRHSAGHTFWRNCPGVGSSTGSARSACTSPESSCGRFSLSCREECSSWRDPQRCTRCSRCASWSASPKHPHFRAMHASSRHGSRPASAAPHRRSSTRRNISRRSCLRPSWGGLLIRTGGRTSSISWARWECSSASPGSDGCTALRTIRGSSRPSWRSLPREAQSSMRTSVRERRTCKEELDATPTCVRLSQHSSPAG